MAVALCSIPILSQTAPLSLGGGALLFSAALWGALGALAGIILSLMCFFLFRAVGAYRWEWRHAGVFRGLNLAWMIATGMLLVAAIGAVQGARWGLEHQLRNGALGREVMPKLGELLTDASALVVFHVPGKNGEEPGIGFPPGDPVETYRKGEWELNVADLRQRLERLPEEFTRDQIGDLKEEILRQEPDLAGSAMEPVLDRLLPELIGWFLRREGVRQAGRYGVTDLMDDLAAEAAAAGHPGTISRPELVRFATERAVFPILTEPVRALAHKATLAAGLILAAAFLLPVLFFRIAEAIRARNAVSAPNAPAWPPGEGAHK
jgi:hypothetical protein